ncbi:MAG TPA: tetratricopeptide repeat protein, partial [Pyrinomonadaceae bacterium]|nr:tetratricopeptide repeat protein [Pyrinomonadaceae bacterium]
LNYGMLERFAPGIIGKPPGDTQAGFEWASLYVLNFLKAYLNGDQQSREFLRQPPTGVPTGLVTVDIKPALESPPRLSELKSLVRQSGMESVVAVYQRLKEKDPQPFSQETFVSLYTWLSFQRDADWKGRRALSLLRVDSYPDSARAHFTMAQVFLQLRETDSARKHFKEALRLLGTDSDPLLDLQTRTRIEAAATRELKNLEG